MQNLSHIQYGRLLRAYQRKNILGINYSLLGTHPYIIDPIRDVYFWLRNSRGLAAKSNNLILGKAWTCPVDGLSVRQQREIVPTNCIDILLAPASTQLSSVPTYHCDMLQLLLGSRTMSLDSRSGGAYRERALRRRHVPMAIPHWWRGTFEFRASLAVGTPKHDGPSLSQACIKPTPDVCYPRSFIPPFILCGSHSPPLLHWLLDCSVASRIPLTSAIPL